MQMPLSITLVYTGTEFFIANHNGEIWAIFATDIAQALGVKLPLDYGRREITLIATRELHNNLVFIPAPPPPPFCEGCAARGWWEAPDFVERELHPLVVGGPLEVWEINLLVAIRNAVHSKVGRAGTVNQILVAAAEAAEEAKTMKAAKETVEETVEESPNIPNVLPFSKPKGRK